MKILIVRLSALGDIVHALPVLAAIKQAMPAAEVDWMVEENYASILSITRGLRRRIIGRARNSFTTDEAVSFGGALGYVQAVAHLRAQDYDCTLDLQGLLKSAGWARSSGARRIIGFDKANLREAQAATFYTETVTPPPGVHVIHKNLSLLTALGITTDAITMPLQPEASAETLAAIQDAGVKKYAVLNPGAAWPNKRWPPERFGALAALLRERTGLRSMITWGPSERELADSIVAASAGAAMPAPPTTVGDLAVLLRDAALVVAGDTGPLHIAAAMGTPLVGLYGPTWPERNGPWDPRDEVISRAGTCVCHHKRQCLRGAPCINEITLDEVAAAAERRLKAETT
ncbi:MAG TPA: lipopolysaccharide heptosyltransferase I [Vicinamibacterales bacterium]|nr:lipopolysaccharide heptosyltransferase I [Vicinamibacterales bacterium]